MKHEYRYGIILYIVLFVSYLLINKGISIVAGFYQQDPVLSIILGIFLSAIFFLFALYFFCYNLFISTTGLSRMTRLPGMFFLFRARRALLTDETEIEWEQIKKIKLSTFLFREAVEVVYYIDGKRHKFTISSYLSNYEHAVRMLLKHFDPFFYDEYFKKYL